MERNLAKQPAGELGYLQQNNPDLMGTESIDKEDLIIPRLKICQALTVEKYEVQLGEFFHSVNGKNYGKSIVIVPIVHWKSHIQFEKGNKNPVCRSLDGVVSTEGKSCNKCGEYRWVEGEQPLCNLLYNYLIVERNELNEAIENKTGIPPFVLAFMKTSIKVAKKINTNAKVNASRKFPIYSQSLILSTKDEPEKFKQGEAFIPELKIGEYVIEKEFAYLSNIFTEMSKMQVDMSKVIKDDELQEEPDEKNV